MTVKTCALCPAPLTDENKSREHIIPNSIGGRKKTSGFICDTCNNNCGKTWESVLAEQFLWFSHAVGIKREHGSPPDMRIRTVLGEELLLRHNETMTTAKPTYVEQEGEDGKINIQISVRTEEEAKRVVKGVARKYPSVDAEAATANLVTTETPLDSPLSVNLQFGGPDGGRSMVKTALALASEYGIDHTKCEKGISYLKSDDALPPFGFGYTVDFVKNRPQEEIFHCVAVAGLPKLGKILAYVEYFNVARILVELSDLYDGEGFYCSYAIDPTSGVEVDIQVDFEQDQAVMQEILDGDGMPLDKYTEAANHALAIVMKKKFDHERDRVVADAAKFAFEKLGVQPGGSLPAEKAQEFSALIMEKLAPFLAAHMRSRFN